MAKFSLGNGVVQRLLSGWRQGEPARRSGLLIVRSGMSPAFHFFCEILANQRGCEMVEDRRQGDRRRRQGETAAERRLHNDRRRNDLCAQDFWIVGGDGSSAKSVARRHPHFVLRFPRTISVVASAPYARKSH